MTTLDLLCHFTLNPEFMTPEFTARVSGPFFVLCPTRPAVVSVVAILDCEVTLSWSDGCAARLVGRFTEPTPQVLPCLIESSHPTFYWR